MSHTFWIQDDMITVCAVHMLKCGDILVFYYSTTTATNNTTLRELEILSR